MSDHRRDDFAEQNQQLAPVTEPAIAEVFGQLAMVELELCRKKKVALLGIAIAESALWLANWSMCKSGEFVFTCTVDGAELSVLSVTSATHFRPKIELLRG